MDLRLTLNQIFKLAITSGKDKTYIIRGPMGSGKSSIVLMAQEHFGDKYNCVTIDCTQWDVGDVQIPDVDKARKVVEFLPNVLLVGNGDKPMFINLDEIGKASKAVQNALLPVMLERRVGAVPLPAGSIVVGATNLGQEGVGDMFPPHARNRVSFIEMRYPTVEEWFPWALNHDVPPPVLAWASENPQIFHSFKDVENPRDNPYIFHPKEQRESFVTPRSLYLASIELRDENREAVGDWTATLAAVAGNIGARAALDLVASVELFDKLPRWSKVENDPENAPLPADAAAVMMVQRCMQKLSEDNVEAVLTYVQRMHKELQVMFATTVMRVRKLPWLARNRVFNEWTAENHWLMK